MIEGKYLPIISHLVILKLVRWNRLQYFSIIDLPVQVYSSFFVNLPCVNNIIIILNTSPAAFFWEEEYLL